MWRVECCNGVCDARLIAVVESKDDLPARCPTCGWVILPGDRGSVTFVPDEEDADG